MVAASAKGARGEPFSMRVEHGKIRELAASLGTSHDAYEGEHALSPPTFLVSAQFLWQTPQSDVVRLLGFDLARVLHGSQEFAFEGEPPRAGTVLTGQTIVEDVYEKQGKRGGSMTFAVLRTDFTTAEGDAVAMMRTTLIETAQAPDGGTT